jgi:hypothetical protein
MDTFFGFAAVVITTIVAFFSALALQALLLRAAFALMQPAAAGRRVTSRAMERESQLVARAFAKGH